MRPISGNSSMTLPGFSCKSIGNRNPTETASKIASLECLNFVCVYIDADEKPSLFRTNLRI